MTETLRLRQSSMQFSDPAKAVAQDAQEAVPDSTAKGAPDFIGFTELGAAQESRIVRRRCMEAGYAFHQYGSVALAIHPKHAIVELGGIDVLDGLRAARGSHQPRGIAEATVITPDGNIVTVHESHWVTDGGRNLRRSAKRGAQSEAMIERVALHGRGRRLSFWMGDTNEDEERGEHEVQRPLTEGRCVSIFDALDKYPSTHGRRTIDVIGHYERDGRVRPESVEVGEKRHSDHRTVDATYSIRKRGRKRR